MSSDAPTSEKKEKPTKRKSKSKLKSSEIKAKTFDSLDVELQNLALREQNLQDMLDDMKRLKNIRLGVEIQILGAQVALKAENKKLALNKLKTVNAYLEVLKAACTQGYSQEDAADRGEKLFRAFSKRLKAIGGRKKTIDQKLEGYRSIWNGGKRSELVDFLDNQMMLGVFTLSRASKAIDESGENARKARNLLASIRSNANNEKIMTRNLRGAALEARERREEMKRLEEEAIEKEEHTEKEPAKIRRIICHEMDLILLKDALQIKYAKSSHQRFQKLQKTFNHVAGIYGVVENFIEALEKTSTQPKELRQYRAVQTQINNFGKRFKKEQELLASGSIPYNLDKLVKELQSQLDTITKEKKKKKSLLTIVAKESFSTLTNTLKTYLKGLDETVATYCGGYADDGYDGIGFLDSFKSSMDAAWESRSEDDPEYLKEVLKSGLHQAHVFFDKTAPSLQKKSNDATHYFAALFNKTGPLLKFLKKQIKQVDTALQKVSDKLDCGCDQVVVAKQYKKERGERHLKLTQELILIMLSARVKKKKPEDEGWKTDKDLIRPLAKKEIVSEELVDYYDKQKSLFNPIVAKLNKWIALIGVIKTFKDTLTSKETIEKFQKCGSKRELKQELTNFISSKWQAVTTDSPLAKFKTTSECLPLMNSITGMLCNANPRYPIKDMESFLKGLAKNLEKLVDQEAPAIFARGNSLLNELYAKGKVFHAGETKKKAPFRVFWKVNLPKNQRKTFKKEKSATKRTMARTQHMLDLFTKKELGKYIKADKQFTKKLHSEAVRELKSYDKDTVSHIQGIMITEGYTKDREVAEALVDKKRMGGDDTDSDWVSDDIDKDVRSY
mmetsp:Transcript_6716/g.11097  ORF Transcript_6716/g.11097 Transcript_6716/m.11097 type:complete len:843 (+) Transcript_6716:51-2579(+)